jgi:hypothetical protein
MTGKLYSVLLSRVANADGADSSPADTENFILAQWAEALTGDYQYGKLDYRLWQIILAAKGGILASGVPVQMIVLKITEIITGQKQSSGLSVYELIELCAGGEPAPPPPTGDFTLIGSSDPFTLIGSSDPFTFI